MNKRLLVISILAFVLFGTVVFFMRDLIFGGVAATYEEAALQQDQYRDKWISYEVMACLGEYAECEKTDYFITTGHEYYYMIWMYDGSVMPMCVSKKEDKEYLDKLSDATFDYLDGNTDYIDMEPRTFIGQVKSQPSEALGYYNSELDSWGITAADGYTIRYTLFDCTSTRGGTIALVCAVMLIPILGITVCFVSSAKNKKKNENPEATYLPR